MVDCIEFKTHLPIQITSTTDSHDSNTPHTNGVGVDLHYDNPMATKSILCAAAGCGAGFGLDENEHPSHPWVAPHIHLQIPAGKKGGPGDLPLSIVTTARDNFGEPKMTRLRFAPELMLLLVAALHFGQVGMLSPVEAKTTDVSISCGSASLPADVQSRLRTEYDSWKIQAAQTLSDHARKTWEGKKPPSCRAHGSVQGCFLAKSSTHNSTHNLICLI